MSAVICLDLEGVLVPEVWINVSERTGIERLRLTTRDVSDYDELMRMRLKILDEHNLKLSDIQAVIRTMEPLEGAREFLNHLRSLCQVVILSDTYYEFADPLIEKLDRPTLFCNSLKLDSEGRIADYCLRQKDGKRKAVVAIKSLQFKVIAVGDSYNDTTMLAEADVGVLFRPPDNVAAEFPQFPVTRTYGELLTELKKNL
ncbi:MAG TPA: bifunctional phosphoserine phosphatase/homoserine phosphotransferase ThrH [archaeon]|nr:bifunctional phosphoserine phosphatase/homoserine phosphotransferase ThrH [archaeon]